MDIFYTNETLYVNMDERINNESMRVLKRRVFGILEDYDIDNIVLNIVNAGAYDPVMFDSFIKEYKNKYQGRITIE